MTRERADVLVALSRRQAAAIEAVPFEEGSAERTAALSACRFERNRIADMKHEQRLVDGFATGVVAVERGDPAVEEQSFGPSASRDRP